MSTENAMGDDGFLVNEPSPTEPTDTHETNQEITDGEGEGEGNNDTSPPKKRPGRPRKNPEIATETIGSTSKPTSTKPKKRTTTARDVSSMGRQLVGLHMLASSITQIPELQIMDAEGVALAEAISAICDEYNLSIDGKTGAALQLFATAGMIYMPRFLHLKSRMNAAKNVQSGQTINVPTN